MAVQVLGKVAYFNKGAYNSETNYEINDVVSYNGSSYVSLNDNNQGNLPTNTNYWSVVAEKGDKGDTGKPFVIEKTYSTIESMVADYDNMNVNDYVMIQGSIEEQENATLWTKREVEVSPYKWAYLADFSGASGITGATPNIHIGTVTEGNEPSVTRRSGSSNENPILDFVLKTGAKGDTGATGNGISSIEKTSTSGLVDTYTITFTNGTSTTIEVTNGRGIVSITKTGTVDYVDTYTITYNDGTTSTFEVANSEVTEEEFNDVVDELNYLYDDLPKVEGEGTNLTLDNTRKGKISNVLRGNTSQDGTPAPDYPQDVEVVSGDNTIKVEGKNLCNGINQNVYLNNTANQYGVASNNSGLYIQVSGGNYTISTTKTQERYRVACSNNEPSTAPQTSYRGQNKDNTSNSITIDTTGYSYLIVNATDLSAIQIEKGSTATTYQPYESQTYPINLGTMELCKIGDYQDYIYKDNGKWYKHSEIGKVVLNGSETFAYREAGVTGLKAITIILEDMKTGSYLEGFCDYFKNNMSGKNENTIRFGANDKLIWIYVNESDFASANDFKTWLSNNNTTVYYVLATPTNTEITDQTLIAQLDNFEKAISYNTQTNISQENNDLPFIISASAFMSLKYLFGNLETRVAELEG